MKINDYTTTEKKDLAQKMNVTLQMVNKWARGQDNMSKNKSVEIEKASGGEINRYEAMYPEINFKRWVK